MVATDVTTSGGLAILAGYTAIYCLPCLILLAIGLVSGSRVRDRLQRLVDKLGTGTVKRSIPFAIILCVLGVAVASIPFWLL